MIAYIFAIMIAVGAVIGLGYNSLSSMNNQMQTTQSRLTSVNSMQQASDVIALEASASLNGAGFPTPTTYQTSGNAADNPTGGGIIYASSIAPKKDGWGKFYGYCVYSIAAATDVSFALISSGQNRTLQTTCTQAKTGVPVGDDSVVTKTSIGAANATSVANTVYFGKPVADLAALNAIVKSTIPDGQARIVKSTDETYQFNAATQTWDLVSSLNSSIGYKVGGNQVVDTSGQLVLQQTATAGGACATPGVLAKDSNGDAFICK